MMERPWLYQYLMRSRWARPLDHDVETPLLPQPDLGQNTDSSVEDDDKLVPIIFDLFDPLPCYRFVIAYLLLLRSPYGVPKAYLFFFAIVYAGIFFFFKDRFQAYL